MAHKLVSKKNHGNYIVDDTFKRTGQMRCRVSDLTELEAKDLVCSLMDCVQGMVYESHRALAIAEKHNFSV